MKNCGRTYASCQIATERAHWIEYERGKHITNSQQLKQPKTEYLPEEW